MTATVISRADGGFGLGLAIAKHLVQARGGEIGVESPSPEFILSKACPEQSRRAQEW